MPGTLVAVGRESTILVHLLLYRDAIPLKTRNHVNDEVDANVDWKFGVDGKKLQLDFRPVYVRGCTVVSY